MFLSSRLPMWHRVRYGRAPLAFALAALAALGATTLAACGPAQDADPTVLRVSAIPDQSSDRTRAQHQPLVRRICERAGVRCEWVDADSYEGLVDDLGARRIDLAYLGGVTFAQARARHDVEPIAMRDVDLRFTSLIVVRRDDPASSLGELRGRTFTFANRSSTSGHHMLRHRLQGEGVVPERHFGSVEYRRTHDEAMQAVASREVAAAGVNASIYFERLSERDERAWVLKPVWQSVPYTDYVWAARPGISSALRARLLDAFLDLDRGRAEDREALGMEGAAGYLPAYPHDFEDVRAALAAQGLLRTATR